MKRLFLAIALVLAGTATFASEFDLPGFVTEIEDGRLWVFKEGSKALEEFKEHGEPGKQFTNIGAGLNDMTVKAADQATLDAYLKAFQQK
ncbi:conserved hypothetical protein [Hahella chejuensis KCTC 2396]|uniref:Uncharacterized protein n=1 Tax=Hahella chejuensis (strain KCTC 2396) TaxID=349521 RepID=Q2SPL1_HAHCH|nr:hypothetical protein [Hahella chejuensis]ABC27413.1 conserved hypothetical protein [Hahella chejuensis KCTC 2396]